MPINYQELFRTLKDGIADLAKKSLNEYINEAVSDGNNIITDMKTNIQNWSQLLANGEIDADNFKSLILGEKDLLKMNALSHAGLALIRIDKFKDDVCNLVVNTVTTLI